MRRPAFGHEAEGGFRMKLCFKNNRTIRNTLFFSGSLVL